MLGIPYLKANCAVGPIHGCTALDEYSTLLTIRAQYSYPTDTRGRSRDVVLCARAVTIHRRRWSQHNRHFGYLLCCSSDVPNGESLPMIAWYITAILHPRILLRVSKPNFGNSGVAVFVAPRSTDRAWCPPPPS